MDMKERFKTPPLNLRRSYLFREDKVIVINKTLVFKRELDQGPSLLSESSHCMKEDGLKM